MEYVAQLDWKRKELREQHKILEALQKDTVHVNHQLESDSDGGTFRMLRQNANYHSLPPSLSSDHAQHCTNMLSSQKFDSLTDEDNSNFRNNSFTDASSIPSRGNDISASLNNMVGEETSNNIIPQVNSANWSEQAVTNSSTSHSENLRKTSYRMIGQLAVRHADVAQTAGGYVPSSVNSTPLSRSDDKVSNVASSFPVTVGAFSARTPIKVAELPELEQTLKSSDTTDCFPQHEVSRISIPVIRPSIYSDGSNQPVLLPDVIGFLSDNVTQANAIVSHSGSAAVSQVPPPVAQKPKFRFSCSSDHATTSCSGDSVSTQTRVITATPVVCVNTPMSNLVTTATSDTEVPSVVSFSSVAHDVLSAKPETVIKLDEPPLTKSADLNQKTCIDENGQDLTDHSKLIDRPTYKPSITYPVRRRSLAEEGSELIATFQSGNKQEKEDTASVTGSIVDSEGSVSKVKTVKNKLRVDISRRVQFEPLALLLDAALEGEIDLLQATLKV